MSLKEGDDGNEKEEEVQEDHRHNSDNDNYNENKSNGTDEISQQVKMLVTKPDDLSSVLGAPIMEGENRTPESCHPTSIYVPWYTHT